MRSLVTVATPAHALTRAERAKTVPLVWAYRAVGAIPPLVNGLAKTLLGAEFMRSQPDDTALVMRALRDAPRTGMSRAMRAVMLERPDISDLLPTIGIPTLMLVPRQDPMLTIEQARAAADRIPSGALGVLGADGHIAPILAAADHLARILREFWEDPSARVQP